MTYRQKLTAAIVLDTRVELTLFAFTFDLELEV